MNRLRMFATACAFAVLAGIGATASAQGKPTVKFHSYGKIILHLPHWVMIEKGFCDKQGITCEPVTLTSAPLAQAASAAGSVDIAITTIDTTLRAISMGNDLQLVGGMWENNPYILVARSDLERPNGNAGYPKNMADLKGRKVGVTVRGSAAEMFARALLTSAGMSPDAVTYVPVGPPGGAFAALAARQVDAAVTWDPAPAFCAASGACVPVVDMRNGEGPESFKALNSTGVFYQAQRRLVAEHPARIDAFNRASAEAIAWLKDPANFEEALALTKKNMVLGDNIPNHDKVYELMVKDGIAHFSSKMDPASVQAWHDFLLETKVLSKSLAVRDLIYTKSP